MKPCRIACSLPVLLLALPASVHSANPGLAAQVSCNEVCHAYGDDPPVTEVGTLPMLVCIALRPTEAPVDGQGDAECTTTCQECSQTINVCLEDNDPDIDYRFNVRLGYNPWGWLGSPTDTNYVVDDALCGGGSSIQVALWNYGDPDDPDPPPPQIVYYQSFSVNCDCPQ